MAANPDTRFRRFLRFGPAVRTEVYENIGQLVANGVPLVEALGELAARAHERGKSRATLAAILARWRKDVSDGKSFSDAVSGDVPQSDAALLRAGESSGQLSRAVDSIVMLSSARKQIRSTIMSSLRDPLLQTIGAFILMGVIAFYLTPTMADVLPREKWRGMGRAMDVGSYAIVVYGPFVLAALVVTLALAFWSLPRWTGPLRLVFEKAPPWSLYKTYMGVGFLMAVAGLIREGMPAEDAIVVVMRDATPWYRQRTAAALRRMEDGEQIATALYRTGYAFPSQEIVANLRVYESRNGFAENIMRLAEQSLRNAVASISVQMQVLNLVSICLIAAVLIWLALGQTALMLQMTEPGAFN